MAFAMALLVLVLVTILPPIYATRSPLHTPPYFLHHKPASATIDPAPPTSATINPPPPTYAQINPLLHFRSEFHLSVLNALPDNKILVLHCRKRHPSKDVGVHYLLSGETFGFSFYPNILGTTIYSCSFDWEGSKTHSFDIFDFHRDQHKAKEISWRVLEEDKICMLDHSNQSYTDCHGWDD